MEKELARILSELRTEKERKFDQTVDLLINLKKFDAKKSQINLVVNVPFRIKDKKICAFLETKNSEITTITPEQFKNYSDKKELKKLIRNFDFFISQASLMPKVATAFGRVLGPAGKMPSPQLGIISEVNKKELEKVIEKINNSTKVKTKESNVKLAVGKQSMKDEELIENIMTVYNAVLKVLPRGIENIKNVEVKFTMTKPLKVVMK